MDDSKSPIRVVKEIWVLMSDANIEGESIGSKWNRFGVVNIRATYKACYSTGQLQSTSIYLPKENAAKAHYYDAYESFNVGLPEPRIRVLIEMTSLGESFVNVRPGKELATCVVHSMLGELISLVFR